MTILLGLENCKICVDCGMENTLKQGDVIQCRECGYRILYKKRTRRSKIYFLWFSFFLSFIYLFFFDHEYVVSKYDLSVKDGWNFESLVQ